MIKYLWIVTNIDSYSESYRVHSYDAWQMTYKRRLLMKKKEHLIKFGDFQISVWDVPQNHDMEILN